MPKKKISSYFKIRVKMDPNPAYRIAQSSGVDPNFLSKILNGILLIPEDDPRVLRIARTLKVPPDRIFENESQQQVA